MTIESIKPCKFGGVFVMFVFADGGTNEMHFATEAEAVGYMNAMNTFAA